MAFCVSATQMSAVRGSSFASGSARLTVAAPARAARRAAPPPRAMAEGEGEKKQAAAMWAECDNIKDYRAMSDAAITEAVMAAKKELMLMGVKKAARQEVPTYSFKALKHKVAQLKTVRREREIEKGMGIRESRGIDYTMRRDNIFW